MVYSSVVEEVKYWKAKGLREVIGSEIVVRALEGYGYILSVEMIVLKWCRRIDPLVATLHVA